MRLRPKVRRGLPVHNYSECYERPEDTPDDAVRPVVP
jgi:hypothetical protein